VSPLRQTTTITSSATPAINVDTDEVAILQTSVDITSMSTNLTGTPFDGQELEIRIRDAGTQRNITWGSSFLPGRGLSLPTKTAVSSSNTFCKFVYYTSSSAWVLQDTNYRAPLSPQTVKTTAYTAAPGDLVPVNASSGAVTITLPTAPSDRSIVLVKKVDSSANAVTVATGGTDLFETAVGPTSLTLTNLYQSVLLQYYATSGIWYATASYGATGGGSGITRSIVSVTTSTTLGSTASTDYVALVGSGGAPILPTAVGNTNQYTIKNVHTANITISTTSSQTIEGSTTYSISPGGSVDLISDNSNWRII